MTEDQHVEPSGEDARQLAAAVHQLVETREQEYEVKRAELEVQSREIDSNERIAMATIEAQSRFHSQRFTRYNAHLIHRYIFIGVMATLLIAFTLGAIYLQAKDLVLEMFKLLIPLVIGTFGGYQWGNRSATKNHQDAATPSTPQEEDS